MEGTTRVILIIIALIRVLLEIFGYDFSKLPLGDKFVQSGYADNVRSFHRWGFIFCLGFLFFEGLGLFFSK